MTSNVTERWYLYFVILWLSVTVTSWFQCGVSWSIFQSYIIRQKNGAYHIYSDFTVTRLIPHLTTMWLVKSWIWITVFSHFSHIQVTILLEKLKANFPFCEKEIATLPLQKVVMMVYFWLQVKPLKQVSLLSKHIEVTVVKTWVELHCEVLSNASKCKNHFCNSLKKIEGRAGHHLSPV